MAEFYFTARTLLCASLLFSNSTASAQPVKLSQIINPIKNPEGDRPASGRYYGALFVKFSGDTPVNDNACITTDFWSYARAWTNSPKSVASSVTLSIQPQMNSQTSVVLPIYQMSANEKPKAGDPRCFSKIIGDRVQLTAFLPNKSQSGLKLNFVLETSESFDSKAATTFASDAKLVTQLLGGANAMAFVSTPAVAKLEQIAGRLDATISTVFAKSSRDELAVGFAFQPPANAFADAWLLSLKGVNADTSAPTLAKNWEPNVTFFMGYKRSLLKDGNEWPEHGEIINRAMFPADITSVNSMAKTITQNLAGGFSHESLNSATTKDGMAQQCQAVRRWIGQFLVGDDALAARFAVVRAYSRYNTMSDIRSDECFSASDITRLKSLSADYAFADPIVDTVPYKVRVSNINAALGQVVSGTMIDGSYDMLKALLVEPESFRFTDVSHKSLFGADAMLALGRDLSSFACVQEKNGGKLLSVGALAVMSAGGKASVLLSFDQAGKLEHVELTSPETVRTMLKVSSAEWPGPQAACKLP